MVTSRTLRRNADVKGLGYQPSKPHPYDIEIFRLSDLKQRTRVEAMRWTYSYEFYMIVCVTHGRCVQFVDFEPVDCSEGAFLLVRPGQAHNFGNDDAWEGWIIILRPEFFLPTVAENHFDIERVPRRLTLKPDELKRASRAIAEMQNDSHIGPSSKLASGGTAAITPTVLADTHKLLRYEFYAFATWLTVVQGKGLRLDTRKPADLRRFDRFEKLVEQHFAEWNQLGEYVKLLGCTEKSLTRATTAAVGISAKAFLARRINIEAKRLLAHTDMPIAAIGEKLGFQEATHFSKFFKRESGCTPREFRHTSLL